MSEAPLLTVRNLRGVFPGDEGDFVAVRDISFTLGRERLGIVGESGSGKSTTGRAIMGLVAKPGRVEPPDKEIVEIAALRIVGFDPGRSCKLQGIGIPMANDKARSRLSQNAASVPRGFAHRAQGLGRARQRATRSCTARNSLCIRQDSFQGIRRTLHRTFVQHLSRNLD